ncbi:hypothetical protein CHUAL_012072 [Chamberlinius hualienensis]
MAKLTGYNIILIFFVCLLINQSRCYRLSNAVWCYRCVSTHPGCGEDFDWRWHWSYTCPAWDDKCVKIVERKGADVLITRDCLSNLEGYRRDIPSDRYEGCRPAAQDVKLSHYTFQEIKELDIKRDYFDESTYCFCDFDYFCNKGVTSTSITNWLITLTAVFVIIMFNYNH